MTKNTTSLLLTAAIVLTMSLGCGLFDRVQKTVSGSEQNGSDSNKTVKDKAVDVAVGDEKIGIPECDEVVDLFKAETNNPDDDFVTKAVKATVLNQMKEQFKKAIEENKTDRAELAKTCREFKANLEKYKAEEQGNRKR